MPSLHFLSKKKNLFLLLFSFSLNIPETSTFLLSTGAKRPASSKPTAAAQDRGGWALGPDSLPHSDDSLHNISSYPRSTGTVNYACPFHKSQEKTDSFGYYRNSVKNNCRYVYSGTFLRYSRLSLVYCTVLVRTTYTSMFNQHQQTTTFLFPTHLCSSAWCR